MENFKKKQRIIIIVTILGFMVENHIWLQSQREIQ